MNKETKTAAIYLRSSKDRKDVSIDAQRRELQNLATDQGIIVVKEYPDVVESAKDENRPGFLASTLRPKIHIPYLDHDTGSRYQPSFTATVHGSSIQT
ncbi:MAG: recombinase family protein [Pseudomonadota bacterium]